MSLPKVSSVAVVGADVSGVFATTYLKEAGLQVTVFERSSVTGGVWYGLLNAIEICLNRVINVNKALR